MRLVKGAGEGHSRQGERGGGAEFELGIDQAMLKWPKTAV